MKGGGRLNKKILTVVTALAVAMTLSTNVIASPSVSDLQKQKSKTESQQKSTQSQLNSVKSKISNLEIEIETYDSQITTLMVQINKTQKQIDSTQKEIDAATADLKKAEADLKNQQNLFDNRMQAIYKSGSESYLDVILDSKSLGDFISKVESLKRLTEYDDKMISNLKTQKDEINKKQQNLKDEQDKLLSLKKGQVTAKDDLVSKESQEKKLVVQYQASQKKLENQIGNYSQTVANLRKQIEEQEKADEQAVVNGSGSGSGGSSFNPGNPGKVTDAYGPAIAAYAMNFLGCPYVWGGNGPYSFDCSGFTKYVYAHFGITLNRVADAQATQGVRLSRSQLQVGDLCFFATPSGYIHHVAIYLGGGMYIHAPHPGDVVKISPLDGTDFCFGARVR